MVKQSSYQYVWQSVSRPEQPGDEHTQIREPHILSQPEEGNFHACELAGLKCTGGGAATEDMHRATLDGFSIFNPFMFVLPPSLPPSLSTNTGV